MFLGAEIFWGQFLGVPYISRTPRATRSILRCAPRPHGLVALFWLSRPWGSYFSLGGCAREKRACVHKFSRLNWLNSRLKSGELSGLERTGGAAYLGEQCNLWQGLFWISTSKKVRGSKSQLIGIFTCSEVPTLWRHTGGGGSNLHSLARFDWGIVF